MHYNIPGFTQLMIIMIYSQAHDIYVPIFYILLQSKDQVAYYLGLQMAINGSGWKLDAKTKTCDFERALLNAMNEQFPESETPTVGCLFHFKQALRRKLIGYRIPNEVIHHLMGPNGLINILTIVPVDEIITKVSYYCSI
jgi:hypothetical protein